VVTKYFGASAFEAQEMYDFVEQGNTIFLASNYLPFEVDSVFGIEREVRDNYYNESRDTVRTLSMSHDDNIAQYNYEGFCSRGYFNVKTVNNEVSLGSFKEKDKKRTNILVKNVGKGQLIVCSTPEVMTNYFLLQDSNIHYYEQLLSNVHLNPAFVGWYSHTNRTATAKGSDNPSSFWGLFKQKEYRAALFCLIALGLLYLVFNTKRKQRAIPVKEELRNDSLAFVETVGLLYFNQKDHPNLAQKMIRHYLDYLRTNYKLKNHLDTELAVGISRKLNKDLQKSQAFVQYLVQVQQMNNMTETDITFLYNQLKNFS